jgi:acyl-coenzyme A synthetase/AMP-(fatty) acid ligase
MSCEPWFLELSVVNRVYHYFFGHSSESWTQDVEEALCLHPVVRECVVIPDPVHRKEVIAIVALRFDLTGREQELRDWVRRRVDPCRTLERIVMLRELPRTRSGELDHSALRDLLLSLQTGIEVVI